MIGRKKIIVLAVVTALLSENSVFSENLIKTTITGNEVSMTIQNEGSKKIFSCITKFGSDVSDAGALYGVCETDGDEVKFIMPDFKSDVDNKYTLYVSGVEAGEFYYARQSSKTDMLSALGNISADELKTSLSCGSPEYNVLGAMGFDLALYGALGENADAAADAFLSSYNGGMTEKEAAGMFNKATAVVSVNNGGDVKKALASADIEFNGMLYSSSDEEFRVWIEKVIKNNAPYADLEDLEQKYRVFSILHLINKANFSQINGLLSLYENDLGIANDENYKKYKTMSDEQKTRFHDLLSSDVKRKPCESVNDLKSNISEIVTRIGAAIVTQPVVSATGGKSSGGNSYPVLSVFETDISKSGSVENQFDDLNNFEWAKASINYLTEKGVISGYGNGKFAPGEFVTREQFVTMICNALGIQSEYSGNIFDDIVPGSWYAGYVEGAYKAGVIRGISDTSFGVGANITREDMAVIVHRAIKAAGLSKHREFAAFDDFETVSAYAKDAVRELYEAEIINGVSVSEFCPGATATRAESAVMIYNMLTKR